MNKMNTPTAVVAIMILLVTATSHARPATRRSASDYDTASRTESSSGSSSGSGTSTTCDRQLTAPERETDVSNIKSELRGLLSTLETTKMWNVRAIVGVYGKVPIIDTSNCTASLSSDQGEAIARSVAFLQKFVRPVGDLLTNETVREVIDLETHGFASKFSTIRQKLATVTTQVYDLVKGDRDIHECILPGLPLASDHTILNPSLPLSSQVRNPSYRDMVVDGVASELQKLVIHLEFALDCYFD